MELQRKTKIFVAKPRSRSSSTRARPQRPGRWRFLLTRSLRIRRPLRFSCQTRLWLCWSSPRPQPLKLWILAMVTNIVRLFLLFKVRITHQLYHFQNRIDCLHQSSRVQDWGRYRRAAFAGAAIWWCEPRTHGCLLHSTRWLGTASRLVPDSFVDLVDLWIQIGHGGNSWSIEHHFLSFQQSLPQPRPPAPYPAPCCPTRTTSPDLRTTPACCVLTRTSERSSVGSSSSTTRCTRRTRASMSASACPWAARWAPPSQLPGLPSLQTVMMVSGVFAFNGHH